MFYLIGLGLRVEHLSLEALEAIKQSQVLFLEAYTSDYSEGSIAELEKTIDKKVTRLGRKAIEEKFNEILEAARENNIALLIFGNPLTATTHIQILLDAKAKGVEYKIIPGISIVNYLPFTGLDSYRFGRVTTLVLPQKNFSPESFYDVIVENKKMKLHTLCLLEIDAEKNKQMTIREAIEILMKIENKKGLDLIQNSILVGIYGAGSDKQKVISGNSEKLSKEKFGLLPQSLVVCGELTEKEKEFLVDTK